MLFTPPQLHFAQAVARLVYSNPFLPERIAYEREALGGDFDPTDPVWSLRATDTERERPNILALASRTEALARDARTRLASASASPRPAELEAYRDLVLYHLFYVTFEHLGVTARGRPASNPRRTDAARVLFDAYAHFFPPGIPAIPHLPTPEHVLAMFFQIRRAFSHIFSFVVGGSLPTARLRADIWQSIFTHNLKRYYRVLYHHMADTTTLITGPSGTGKELVARAVAASRYIPYDPAKKAFAADYRDLFFPLNLSALSPTLIESELFGHRRGSFTGAAEDRAGYLETCPALGTVFLDEIGDLDPLIQVKLLRVLQVRTFQRLGDTRTLTFSGKVIAATNRDLPADMASGAFRQDFYYRLCGDTIRTPSLREQLDASPDELPNMVHFIAARIAGDEADAVTDEAVRFITTQLPPDYPWQGNFRELEQCVRNIMIRGTYLPPQPSHAATPSQSLAQDIASLALTADELLARYCAIAYRKEGAYDRAAKRIGLDRRTLKAKIDQQTC